MAGWQAVVSEVARYRVVRRSDHWVAIEARSCPVIVRAVRDHGTAWIQIDAILCRHRDVSLEALLRHMGKGTVGAVVIVGDVCLMRERIQLGMLRAPHIHVAIDMVIAHTMAARRVLEAPGRRDDSIFDYLIA